MEYVVGIDEVGRGALAGPVVVGAVVVVPGADFPDLSRIFPKGLKDSKAATKTQRQAVSDFVRLNLLFGLGEVSAKEVDALGLTAALTKAAGLALDEIFKTTRSCTVHADAGLFHPYETEIVTKRSVKADETIIPVLLASHLAKVFRDTYMKELAQEHPYYGWETNVGYGTKAHMQALREHGATAQHRQSFLKSI